jgi:hypothetical protein
MPAGVPLAPPFAPWVATTNVWVVNVEGEYERFAVETPRRTPTPGDASLSYVRDGTNVTLDVDGDGTDELLGTSDRVGFDISTAVVVVVPSGGTGVGDVDGNLQERSPGWEAVEPSRPNTTAFLLSRPNRTLDDYIALAKGNGTIVRGPAGYTVVSNQTLAEIEERRARNGTRGSNGTRGTNGTGGSGEAQESDARRVAGTTRE